MKRSDLESKIQQLLDGELSATEVAALETALLGDPQAREMYRRMVRLHSHLETRFESRAVVANSAIVPVERIMARQRKRMFKLAFGAAAAVLAVSLLIFSMTRFESPVASFRTIPGSVFKLVHAVEDGTPPEGNVLVEGSRLQLVSGTLEGTFKSGVRVVIDAPCDLRVVGETKVELSDGAAWFTVPERAVGFEVETEELLVVDLGTAFGVIATAGAPDEIHVTKGAVEVTVRQVGGQKASLFAGQARQVDQGFLKEVPPRVDKFLTQLPETRSITVANHSFESDQLEPGHNVNRQTPAKWLQLHRRYAGYANRKPGGTANLDTTVKPTPDPKDGEQFGFANSGGLYQVLYTELEADSIYTLRVDVGAQSIHEVPSGTVIRLGTGESPGEKLLEAKVVLSEVSGGGEWHTWVSTFTAGDGVVGERLRVELVSGGIQPLFDNVRLDVRKKH